MSWASRTLLWIFISSYLVPDTCCLRNVHLWVPEAVRAGSNLQLYCQYDIEEDAGETLYSIKFYFEDQEFYSYVPKESPPMRLFPVQHVNVVKTLSNSSMVTLGNVEKEASGQYKCEVSADAPYFHTLIRTGRVFVTEGPHKGPEISTDKPKYKHMELLRARCLSRYGYPAPNLTFFINNEKVTPSDAPRLSSSVRVEKGGLETSSLQMEATVHPGMFIDGRLWLRCLATQFNVYQRSVNLFVLEEPPDSLLPNSSASQNNNKRTVGLFYIVVYALVILSPR